MYIHLHIIYMYMYIYIYIYIYLYTHMIYYITYLFINFECTFINAILYKHLNI